MKSDVDIKELQNLLKESANFSFNLAKGNCKNGIVSEDCYWYHSIWQYLRLLDVVSSPSWHSKFYINNFLTNFKDNINILISGTADYTMLYYVIKCIQTTNNKQQCTNVYVLDTCKTPLLECQWLAQKEKFNINCVNKNILEYANNNFFDIICTDAFLTRFNNHDVDNVISSWYRLLKKDGKIITTIRIHEDNEPSIINHENIDKFINKVERKYLENKDYIRLSKEQMIEKAKTYAIQMKSNKIGNEKDIIKRFSKFNIEYKIENVIGELVNTKYMCLVAKK